MALAAARPAPESALEYVYSPDGDPTSDAFRAGKKAERRQDYDAAVLEYSKAVTEAPDNPDYRRSLSRARLRASEDHAIAARRLAGRGQYKQALEEYRLALDLNPSANLAAEIQEAEEARQRGIAPLDIPRMKERMREKSLAGLALGPEAR